MMDIIGNKMPVIDTHRHLGGSIPISFVWDIIHKLGLYYLAESRDEVSRQMTFTHGEQYGFHRFLDKFRILDEIPWTEELIDASIKSVCDELENEKIDYTWMDFSVNKYMRLKWHRHEAVEFIYNSFQRHRPGKVGLILSLKYESMRASQRQQVKFLKERILDLLIGIDLVGDEEEFDDEFHCGLLQEWCGTGKIIRAHVGEFGSHENIRCAINCGANHIAHGIKIVNDAELIKLAISRDICFDLGITSNFMTGVASYGSHPLVEMINNGLEVTIGTDDPIICSTTLDDEFEKCRQMGLTDQQINKIKTTAVERSQYRF